MAFCNSCGANLEATAQFCNKCGAVVTGPAPGSPSAAPAPMAPAGATPQGSSALKIILIVVAVVVALGIIGIGTISFITWRVARGTHVRGHDGNVRVETPFGTVQSTTDPNQAARNLGVDVYPGATVVKGGSADMTIGGMHTAAANFVSDDPASRVADFYKSKFPRANMTSTEGDHYAIVTGDQGDMVTISIEPQDGKTQIHIARVTGKGDSSSN